MHYKYHLIMNQLLVPYNVQSQTSTTGLSPQMPMDTGTCCCAFCSLPALTKRPSCSPPSGAAAVTATSSPLFPVYPSLSHPRTSRQPKIPKLHARARRQRGTLPLLYYSNREEEGEENDENVFISLIDAIAQIGTTNTPGFQHLSLAYPLVLGLSAVLLPLSTSALFIGFFVAFAMLGRTVVGVASSNSSSSSSTDNVTIDDANDDDTNEENAEEESLSTDFAALVAAILSAGLLAPDSTTTTSSSSSIISTTTKLVEPVSVLSIGVLILVVMAVSVGSQGLEQDGQDQRTPERIRMDTWDDQFDSQQQQRQHRQQQQKKEEEKQDNHNKKKKK